MHAKRIAIIEDDAELAGLISDYLEAQGFEVSTAASGTAGLTLLRQHPDLAILDIMLPELDGFEVCKQARHFFHGPILMLTARSDNIDEILGLEVGADDYVHKPVEPRVLLAHVKALLRRSESNPQVTSQGRTLTINDLTINDAARTVMRQQQLVSLSNAEYELLWLLARHAGQILSRDYIFENLRGIDYDGCNRSIDINISRIRAKLGDDPNAPTLIKTVRNRGYLLTI
ncbi:DNA-binding response regulator [Bacterioplanes sanyensis]|uniref:DNA-binding response regulator n=1 Tax=Bacterioplanes sanyensis TaxID=1249553 RepID=A0A222FIH1_9GAMM|nr:response regulator transcription factor [Bacterioplanes sanyensis]ASP38570.1 DNA-binding response regulator [Bacterioplanes sanyensis]